MYKILAYELMIAVVIASVIFDSTETAYFGNDPGSCETRADYATSDYTSAGLFIAGRTKSKNLASSTGDNTCYSSLVPFLVKLHKTNGPTWLKYFTTSTYMTEFTAVGISFNAVYDVTTSYNYFATAVGKSTSIANEEHKIVFLDYSNGDILKAIPIPRNSAPLQNQFVFQKLSSSTDQTALTNYDCFIAGDSENKFALIKMNS